MFEKFIKDILDNKEEEDKVKDNSNSETSKEETELTSQSIKSVLSKNADLQSREIYICGKEKYTATLIYIDGLINSKVIGDDVIKPLMENDKLCEAENEDELIDMIEHGFVYFPSQKTRKKTDETISDILTGSCALIFNNKKVALTFETKGFEQRSISEPTEENIVKGPKDTFVESLRINTATLRRKIKTQNLVIEQTIVGKQTLTPIAIVYMDGIANKVLIDEVKKRLDSINIDGVIESGFIEEYIIDERHTAFPQVSATERPDTFSIGLLEGRVGLIIDGIPIAYTVPGTVYQFLKTPDDYSQNYIMVSLIRVLRYLLVAVTLFLPAFYIAVTTFNNEMIPSELALSIASSKEGVPYHSFIEVIFMLISFEILLESGLRLPKNIGQAVSIVGALVVGESAVSAKFISPAVVVIIAITAISGFTVPNQSFANALRLWRFVMVLLSSIIGLVGMSFGAIFLLYHLAKIETFGVPYLSPFVANDSIELEDSIIRMPLDRMKYRPKSLKTPNKRRQK